MKKVYKYFVFISFGLLFFSCKKFLEPEQDNSLTKGDVLSIPQYAEGVLLAAYNNMPSSVSFNLSFISDEAVTNSLGSSYLLMATGSWASDNNPISAWSTAYTYIYYINSFLEMYEDVRWNKESVFLNDLHLQRLTGEAYGLRAWWQFQLLINHSGIDTKGRLLGYPIVKKALKADDDLNLPRNTFTECVSQILEDCDSAIVNLPDTYFDVPDDPDYNTGMGQRWNNRMNGLAARALKSYVTLYAASPAYNLDNKAELWQSAAQRSGELIELMGGLAAISPSGLTWYTDYTDKEIIWARAISTGRGIETSNFPPSLQGGGTCNPSQELVNAFPMANGYPIADALSGYDQTNPYQGRDPRLATYIIFNGNALGGKGVINTYVGAPLDGINVQTNSTRTGYYVKKFLLDNVSIADPPVNQIHFITYYRLTEILLNYAEAANEAYGPDSDPNGYGVTSRQVIAAIRKRAGISQPDTYLAGITSRDEFRKLVHNERRLELAFEGERFYDMRRWKDLAAFKAPVTGVLITGAAPSFTYDYQKIEDRNYEDYMIYGPIPKNELRRSKELTQNQNWQE